MIPKETVDRILDTAQIADVVGDFVSLKRRRRSMSLRPKEYTNVSGAANLALR